ncbi:MAG TPA: LPS export ABC transporter periplasmic protein LptC [Desulfurivibrio alkaliphilus]|uniref:LPS export ABC transporter periplasmic protein LptC n=1 Tax=Desulfurivibrio alkaliphilus TaxID=427923 RepID=A0A7C2TFW8_9BACT|nr:LPS export ABC transporter periplasmic protein LptC [Desulfurivibrio alkaliphilus]
MMAGARNLLWLIPLLLLLGWPLYGAGVRWFLAPPPWDEGGAGRSEEQTQRFILDGVRFYQDEAGVRRLRIDTPSLRTDPQSDKLLLAAIDGALFREEGDDLLFTAARGYYDPSGEMLYLEGDVRLNEAERLRLTTPALSYHGRQRRVSSRAGVEIFAEELTVSGRNLDYDLESGDYILAGNVHFVVR